MYINIMTNKEYRKEYIKQYRLNNPEHLKHFRKYHKSLILPYHIVYLLPDHNYVGVTNNPKFRMSNHKSKYKRNTDNWIELARFDTREEALQFEAAKHAAGYEGAK